MEHFPIASLQIFENLNRLGLGRGVFERGKNLGLTLNDIATQVRQAFYGAEAQRIQRGTDDIRVMVRYPEDERRSLGNLEDLLIRTPGGAEVPFLSVARYSLGNSYSSINRPDGRPLHILAQDGWRRAGSLAARLQSLPAPLELGEQNSG